MDIPRLPMEVIGKRMASLAFYKHGEQLKLYAHKRKDSIHLLIIQPVGPLDRTEFEFSVLIVYHYNQKLLSSLAQGIAAGDYDKKISRIGKYPTEKAAEAAAKNYVSGFPRTVRRGTTKLEKLLCMIEDIMSKDDKCKCDDNCNKCGCKDKDEKEGNDGDGLLHKEDRQPR